MSIGSIFKNCLPANELLTNQAKLTFCFEHKPRNQSSSAIAVLGSIYLNVSDQFTTPPLESEFVFSIAGDTMNVWMII